MIVFKMANESELLTHFHKICWNAEVLAMRSVHDIQIPICGFLTQLTSTDCLNLLKNELDDWSKLNQRSVEYILLSYLITDYISCGLSSPIFHAVFHKTLQSDKSKIKLLKDLITIWDSIFKNYEVTSQNIGFIKHFIVCLEHLFGRISNSAPDFRIKFLCNKVLDRIKYYIRVYEQNILDGQVFYTLSNNMHLHNSDKNRLLGIENIVPKKSNESKNLSVLSLAHRQTDQRRENMVNMKGVTLNNEHRKRSIGIPNNHQKYNIEPIDDDHLSKKSKLISDDVQNILNESSKSDPDKNGIIQPPQQKLNAFQVMMLNARRLKTNKK